MGLLGSLTADLGIGAGAEALGVFASDLDLGGGLAHLELLNVGVEGDELDPTNPRLDHPIDGVTASTADANHADHGKVGALGAPAGRVEAAIVGVDQRGSAGGLGGGALGLRRDLGHGLGRLEQLGQRPVSHAIALCHLAAPPPQDHGTPWRRCLLNRTSVPTYL